MFNRKAVNSHTILDTNKSENQVRFAQGLCLSMRSRAVKKFFLLCILQKKLLLHHLLQSSINL